MADELTDATDELDTADAPEEGAEQPEEAAAPEVAPEVPDELKRAQEALAAQDRDIVARTAALNAQQHHVDEYNRLRQMASSDPMAAIRALGVDPMAVVQGYVGSDEPDTPDPHVQRMEQAFQQKFQAQGEQLKALQDTQTFNGIRSMINGNREQFPIVHSLAQSNDSLPAQINQQAELYRNAGRDPDYGAILSEIERQSAENIFGGLSADPAIASKYADRISALTGQPGAQQPAVEQPSGAPSKGITSSMGAEARTAEKNLSDDELDAEMRKGISELLRGK
jgi:hypothetical protein